MLPPSSELP